MAEYIGESIAMRVSDIVGPAVRTVQSAHQQEVDALKNNPQYRRLYQTMGPRMAAVRLVATDVARLINMDKKKYPFLAGILAGGLAKGNNIQKIAEHLILIID